MKLLSNLIWKVNVLFAIAMILAYVSPYVDPSSFWLLSFFGVFYPVWLIIHIVFIIYWLIVSPWKSLLSLTVVALGWSYLMSFININTTRHSNSAHVINIMSYNIQNAGWAYSTNREEREENRSRFISYLESIADLDILCTQETGEFGQETLRKAFSDMYLHTHKNKGAAIWSKYPIVNKGLIDFGTRTNSCLWADIALAADTIRVYSTHLYSNRISREATQVLDNVNLNEKETWSGIGGILNKYKKGSIRRAQQAEQVKRHVSTSPYPVIVTGDFNDPPTSYTYRTMKGNNLIDSFCQKGKGISSTYAGRIPLLRIDYILADKHFDILSYNRMKVGYSDHYPIMSSVILITRH